MKKYNLTLLLIASQCFAGVSGYAKIKEDIEREQVCLRLLKRTAIFTGITISLGMSVFWTAYFARKSRERNIPELKSEPQMLIPTFIDEPIGDIDALQSKLLMATVLGDYVFKKYEKSKGLNQALRWFCAQYPDEAQAALNHKAFLAEKEIRPNDSRIPLNVLGEKGSRVYEPLIFVWIRAEMEYSELGAPKVKWRDVLAAIEKRILELD